MGSSFPGAGDSLAKNLGFDSRSEDARSGPKDHDPCTISESDGHPNPAALADSRGRANRLREADSFSLAKGRTSFILANEVDGMSKTLSTSALILKK